MTSTDAGAYAARLERVRAAVLDARQAKTDPPEAASVDEDPLAGVPLDASSVEGPGQAPASSPDEPVDLPPPPVVTVRRLVESATPPPTRQNGKRLALGFDPLEDTEIPRGLKSSIERVVAGLAERRDAE
jgi:hypothetical protein